MSVLETVLAISLVHLNPPTHHIRAQRLLDNLLSRSSNNFPCLIARAYIYEHNRNWSKAFLLFSEVYGGATEDTMRFEARAERVWCMGNIGGRITEALTELHEVATAMDQDLKTGKARKARAWWRYGQCLWSSNGK